MKNTMKNLNKSIKLTALCVSAAVLSACVSTPVTSDTQLTWPDTSKYANNLNEGSFPNLDSLAIVKLGMTKDQIRHLIGMPHTNELYAAREWTYVFHFHTANQPSTCFYKVTFDNAPLVSGLYWHPVSPENVSCPPAK